jgi:hypothetical protein
MAITYSTNLKLTLIGTGDQAGTWGNTTNTNLGTLIEQAIAGYVSQTVADSASSTSLSIADGTSSVARNMVLVLQGALTLARDIILPTSTKLYFIHNNTSGGFAVTAKCSGQTGVSIPNGAKVILACNGTDIVEAFNYSGSLIFPTSATITTLSGTTLGYGSASITNASIASGTVTNLRATTFQGGSASITNADIDSAVIGILTNTTFSSGSASITTASFGSATVTNLLATNFSCGSESITTASFGSATVTNLRATTFQGGSASITNADIDSAVIGILTNTTFSGGSASITTANFASGTVTNLLATTFSGGSASITTASVASGTVTNLLATNFSGGSASITTVTGTTFGTTGASQIRGASGAIGQLTVTSATITNLNVTSLTTGNFPLPTSATIATLSGTTLGYASASITTASIASGTITNLLATTFSGGSASITTVTGTTFGTTGTTQLRGASAAITHLFATSATITTLTSTSAGITTLSSTTFSGGSASITTVTGTTFGTTGTTQLRGASAAITTLSVTNAINGSVTGNAGTVTNGVYTTGNQTIGGLKIFSNDIGGTFGGQLQLTNSASGATNPNKHFRVGPTGTLEIINSAYNAVPFTFTDAGIFTAISEINGTVFKDYSNSAFFLDPNNTDLALNVAGAISLPNNKSLLFRNAANTASASFLLQSDDNFVVYNASSTPIMSFGQTSTPLVAYGANSNNRMLVNGSTNGISFNTNGTEKVTIDSSGNVVATGNVTAYSDIRVKDNVENITGAIGKLNQIRGVTYTRIDLDDKERKYAGVIAQEIEQVLPEAVFDNGKVKSVDYNATIALLIEAVKEQQGQINELKLTIEQLKGN